MPCTTATAVRVPRFGLHSLGPRLTRVFVGAATAKYAGEHVHQRLVQDPAYKEGRYDDALKNAFLGTDADMKDGVCISL